MSIKSFIIALIIVFILYEVISVIIGVFKKKKQQKNIGESEDNNDVSNKI